MASLTLTKAERTLFQTLSDEAKSGWKVVLEQRSFADTDVQLVERLSTAEIHDPVLQALYADITKLPLAESINILQKTDISTLSPNTISQLLFLIGPEFVSRWIEQELGQATTQDDMTFIQWLSESRTALLDAYNIPSAT